LLQWYRPDPSSDEEIIVSTNAPKRNIKNLDLSVGFFCLIRPICPTYPICLEGAWEEHRATPKFF
jgi:hypothetical protein